MANDNKLVTLADLGEAYNDLNSRKKEVQTAVTDPTASGNAVAFIDTITQNAQGVITPTKKTVPDASQSASGLMTATDKAKLDGIAAGAQVNSVTGVKGDAEGSYRQGNVNLTPANIGAVPMAGNSSNNPMTGPLYATVMLNARNAGEAQVEAINTNTGTRVVLDSTVSNHGLWSAGYYDGTAFVSSPEWMIVREQDGQVKVADHNLKSKVMIVPGTSNPQNTTTIRATYIYVVSVGNGEQNPNGCAIVCWYNPPNLRKNIIFGGATVDVSYSNGTFTITNLASYFQAFMIFYN